MATVKRWIITGVSAGVGLGVALTVVILIYSWYSSRPKQWNPKAITASFDYADTEGTENTPIFFYTLENNTNSDYHISIPTAIRLMAKLERQKSLSQGGADNGLTFDSPIFIPAKQRIRFAIHMNYPTDIKTIIHPTEAERKKSKEQIAAWLNKEVPNLAGFCIYDDSPKYQIDFPKGW